ncbi:aminoglycoside phosphotransferase family protein [Paenibacillus filicis]|uniref:Aminoglycoside phosphotransferase family protein n=1 Tax=Paenibacillus gyeongsangnamensis TaxID=3388067 RepID=A0ABT4Q5J0_9BACL|nr:aminoglycoside phosphotransferase family protein [Paenibacillus filicis]MCZ8512141.1 aminoglycoside phosphotransferase family protein [Paenibacillus filicis]
MNDIHEQELPERVRAWAVRAVDPRARVLSAERLQGGTSSIVHQISVGIGKEVKSFVLRQFHKKDWLEQEPDLARHEAEALGQAARAGVPTPEIIAYDETGLHCGLPTVLMTKLEGNVVLNPRDMKPWISGLAEALVRIHAVEADDFPWAYFTYQNLEGLEIPEWSDKKDQWKMAVDLVRGPRPEVRPCFIHRDYHPANVLWHGSTVSGVVDWVNACRGPAGIDIGHCRVNLAQLYGVAAADAFLSAYLVHAGASFCYDPYWDLLSLMDILFGPPEVFPGYIALGMTGLTDRLMMERLDEYMVSLLERFDL